MEYAVVDDGELDVVRGNDARVLVDATDLTERIASILSRPVPPNLAAEVLFGKILGQVLIGMTRYGQGEPSQPM